jgi:hypothetical protein
VNRGLCYCRDCQAFAHVLGRAGAVLTPEGGTDIVQTEPRRVRFVAGLESLGCLRLTPNGLLRWYATCCSTPVGNTPADFKVSFVGLIHACLEGAGQAPLEEAFGPIRMRVHTRSARGEPKPSSAGMLGAVVRIAGAVLRARVSGSYRETPFFDPVTGRPVVEPRVLTTEERNEAMAKVGA